MPKLIVQRDQLGIAGREAYELPPGFTPTDALMRHISGGINPNNTRIYLGISELQIPTERLNGDSRLFMPMGEYETLFVVHEAKGVDPISIALITLAVVTSVVAYLSIPDIPGDVGAVKQSPNNKLQGQTNVQRPYEAYPLIFGSPRCYPDLTGEAVTEYVNNQKIVRQLMNIGMFTFDIDEIRAGDTPLGAFDNATSTIYEPVNKVVTVPQVTTSFAVNEIDGQELVGRNEGEDGDIYNLSERDTNQATYAGQTFYFEVIQNAQSDALKADFDATIGDYRGQLNYRRDNTGLGGYVDASGAGTITTMVLQEPVGEPGYYEITIVEFTGPKAAVNSIVPYQGPFKVTEKLGLTIGPIKTGTISGEMWFNIIFRQGLKGTADFRLRTQQLDGPHGTPIGPVTTDTFSYSKDTRDQQFFTYKKVLGSEDYYQFTLERTNNSQQSAENPDAATFEAAYSIRKFTNLTFGNNTLIDVTMPATINATSLRENKINLSLTAKVITYENGVINYTPTPSRKMADALLHLYVEYYGLDPETLALDELYEIQDRLDAIDPRLATFDFTFDDLDVALEDRMDSILQVARCFKWLDGDVYRFGRNEKKDNPTTLITRGDIVSEDNRDYSLGYNPQLLQAYDSVKVEYVNKVTNKKAYVFRTIDINSPDPENPLVIDGVGQNPMTLQLAGCSEEFNAINRAEMEMRTLIYQRYRLSDTLLPSGMLLDRGDQVLYSEQYNNDGETFDGEIIAINGDIATVSESIDWVTGQTYQVHYTTTNGDSVGPFSATEVPNDPFKFQCSDLSQAYLRDSTLGFTIQMGSRYIITPVTELAAAKWTVMEKEAAGNGIQVTLINYDDRVYEFDS